MQVPASELGDLVAGSGELALYAEPDYGNPDAVVGYVQWGDTGHKREEPAVAAGVWDEGAFVDAGEGAGLRASGPTTSPSGWTVT